MSFFSFAFSSSKCTLVFICIFVSCATQFFHYVIADLINRHTVPLHFINGKFQRKSIRFKQAIRKYTRQYRFRTEFKINAILLKSHQSVLEENRSLYHECVPVLKSESILIFLTVKYRFLQLPDPVPPAIHDRTDLSVLNQLEIQFKFPAPMSVPPS